MIVFLQGMTGITTVIETVTIGIAETGTETGAPMTADSVILG